MSDSRMPWAAKARALLLASAGTDVPSRFGPPPNVVADIAGWLADHGAGRDTEDAELRLRCARDAYDAQAALPAALANDGPTSIIARHPLSAEPLREQPIDASDAAQAWERFWTEFCQRTQIAVPLRLDTEKGYRALFAAFVEAADAAELFRILPASPLSPDCTIRALHMLTAALVGARHEGRRAALLYLHLGPVQSFITAARRTHDLWAGSYILSFLAFQALRAVATRLGPDAIVSPNVVHLPLAQRLLFERPTREEGKVKLLRAALPNRLLAVVPEHEGQVCASAATKAIAAAWQEIAENAAGPITSSNTPGWNAGFQEQIAQHLELDAVVQGWPNDRSEARHLFEALERSHLLKEPWPDRPELFDRPGLAYGPLFDLTHRVLAAHRATPDVRASSGDARPKCTQCGEREQMGPRDEPHRQAERCRKLWDDVSSTASDGTLQITHGERLCAVCITKRFAPRTYFGSQNSLLGLHWGNEDDRTFLRFPSVPSIAAAPYLKHLRTQWNRVQNEASQWLDKLDALQRKEVLNFTPPGNLLPGLGPLGRKERLLQHDGTWLYETSYDPDVCWRNHFSVGPNREDARCQKLTNLLPQALRALRALCHAAGDARPSSYYAVIQLDGDRMGEWLTGRHPNSPTLSELFGSIALSNGADRKRPLFPALHGELSSRLGLLAEKLHELVDSHLGRVVYAGGDDLLAILPLGTALACLGKLRRVVRSWQYLGSRATVSAGVAIAHWRDPLPRVLQAARNAQRRAKGDVPRDTHGRTGRDRLAIHLDRRSGEPLSLVLPFEAGDEDVLDALSQLVSIARSGQPSAFDDRDEERLASSAVAYKLAEELRVLAASADDVLRQAFWDRTEILLGLRSKRRGRMLNGLPRGIGALFQEDTNNQAPALEPTELIDLLLFTRFLMREEKGLGEIHRCIAHEGLTR